MEPLSLKRREAVEDTIENWDDDEDLQGFDDVQFRNVSSTTSGSVQPHHRESTSSRMSMRSDRESNGGGDEDWQVLLPTDDEKSTANAITQAKSAGIPIPQNVPASALVGGTIKRMGGRRLKKALGDDWGDDIELPSSQDGGLRLRKHDGTDYDDALRQFSAEFPPSPSPAKLQQGLHTVNVTASSDLSKPKAQALTSALDKFKDCEDDTDFGDVPTIKIAKNRSPQKPINFTPPITKTTQEPSKNVDNMEDDFEFPDDGKPLRLSTNRELPKTPVSQLDDTFNSLDMDWAEGSLGTRFGGTRRDIRSNPSSSVSAFSPSASSRLTGNESEEDGLDELILPAGPFKFEDALKRRLECVSPGPDEQIVSKQQSIETIKNDKAAREDFLSGIDIGDGEVFESGKLTLNRNIKHKATRQTSPQRRAAMTLTFTNKAESCISKIPRPQSHDRPRPTLEPVSESGGPMPQYRRPGSRMMGHSAQSSTSAIPTPSTPSGSIAAPATPTRRGLNPSISRDALKPQSNTMAPQYLKNKRSMPLMSRNAPSPARPQASYQRAPSRGGDYSSRHQNLPSRPKTPIDRSGADSSLANARKQSIPFLPAGTSHAQSHHVSVKASRNSNRPNSSDSNENFPINRPISRLSNLHRPSTPTSRRDLAPDFLAREAASKRTLTKPTRRRVFGDGNELEIFDDLPTSATSESKFTKAPIARGAPKSVQMRSKLGTQHGNSSSTSLNEQASLPQTPSQQLSPTKRENVPRFARDTNASRVAREQRIGSVSAALHAQPCLPTVRETGGPLSNISTNWSMNNSRPPLAHHILNSSSKQLASPMHPKTRSKHHNRAPPQKPRLIKPMNEAAVNSAKTLKGMSWNPNLFRWEGNENALTGFDMPAPGPGLVSPVSPGTVSKAAPALIANVGPSTKGVQMSGGMVFDPARMCWLKMAPSGGRTGTPGSNAMSPDAIDEEEDPFAGLDDLEDGPTKPASRGGAMEDSLGSSSFGGKKMMEEEEEGIIQEEFDVGPEFIRRQRVEEERWRAKVSGWVGQGIGREDEGRGGWKWAIRDKAMMLG